MPDPGVGWFRPLLIAAVIHAGGLILLSIIPAPEEEVTELPLLLRLPVVAERPLPTIIVSAEPEEEPPDTPPPLPAESPPQQRSYPEEVLRELAEERERLQAQLQRARAEIAGLPPPKVPNAPPGETATPGKGAIGTIRELDFSGAPESVVKELMARYRLRVTVKAVPAGSNQTFLSSAAAATGERFYANRQSPAGVYQVFELSRTAIARMSQLEEEAIRRRGLDPKTAIVRQVKFGIVQTPTGWDLGVTAMETEATGAP